MFKEQSRLYSQILSLCTAVAPAEWSRLWLDVECESSSWAVGGYWECGDTADVIFFEVPAQARLLVSEAWSVARANQDNWSTAIFRVDRPDKLQITFGHQDLDDESYSSSESQATFRKNTFGDRKIRSTIEMPGAVNVTPEMLKSGIFGKDLG